MVRVLILMTFAMLVGCTAAAPSPPVIKVIAEKIQATEQRMSVDFMDSQTVRGRAVSVYYLVAGDGTLVEVDLKMYAKTKVGDSIQSTAWK